MAAGKQTRKPGWGTGTKGARVIKATDSSSHCGNAFYGVGSPIHKLYGDQLVESGIITKEAVTTE